MAAVSQATSIAYAGEDDAHTVLVEVKAYEDVLEDHRRHGEDDALLADIEKAVALYRQAEGADDQEEAQERLAKLVGATCRRCHEDRIRVAALHAMEAMGHEACARYLKPFLRPVKDEDDEVPTTLLPAIAAAGGVADDRLVRPLLDIVEDSENYTVAAQAVAALGKFKEVRWASHKRILETLGDTLVKDMPGGPSRGHSDPTSGSYIPAKEGSAGNARWGILSVAIPKGLNELTGQEFRTMDDWMAMIREHRHDLKVLFVDRYRDE
jgi:hypothetical protein